MRRLIYAVVILALIMGLAPSAIMADGGSPGETKIVSFMPPELGKIASALQERGVISPGASKDQVEAAVKDYLAKKLSKDADRDEGNPLASKKLQHNEDVLNNDSASSNIKGHKLGDKTQVDPSTPTWNPIQDSDKLLVILVEFSAVPYTWTPSGQAPRTAAGPPHNQIPVPNNDFDLWIPDFSQQHYHDMLFTPGGWTINGQPRGSLRDYYLEQSYGKYAVNGDVYGWYTVDKPEAYYGDDRPSGGADNLYPGTPRSLLSDAVTVINAQGGINWADYDLKDPYDGDNDGDLNEPDGLIDHALFVHAGIDQYAGGGAQGDDAIWAHSSTAIIRVGTRPDGSPIYLYNYTMMPEDGGIGVFAHEFGHDLGLPDEYDTSYSGSGESIGFWSLMANGSWIGKPSQTQPADISVWGKYALGWLNPAVVNLNDLTKDQVGYTLDQVERAGTYGTNALRISLPPKQLITNVPYSGSYEWFGGKADLIDSTLRRTVDLTGKTSASLSFATWYEIEDQWDFGFVQVSTDGGITWTSLPISGTTTAHDPSAMPTIVANLPGFTGSSGDWVVKTFDLKDYVGQQIQLRFRYMTDWATTLAGFYVDNIEVTADGARVFFDDVESLDPAWITSGWTRDQGLILKDHYYLLEWRNLHLKGSDYNGVNLVNFDQGLKNAYIFDPYAKNPDQPYYFDYDSGLLLWYRDTSYTDNWVGMHPGHGFLGIVDAHWKPDFMPRSEQSWLTRFQIRDAAFGLSKTTADTIGYYGISKLFPAIGAVSKFNDEIIYHSDQAPDNSMILVQYGLKFKVAGVAADSSAALIGLSR